MVHIFCFLSGYRSWTTTETERMFDGSFRSARTSNKRYVIMCSKIADHTFNHLTAMNALMSLIMLPKVLNTDKDETKQRLVQTGGHVLKAKLQFAQECTRTAWLYIVFTQSFSVHVLLDKSILKMLLCCANGLKLFLMVCWPFCTTDDSAPLSTYIYSAAGGELWSAKSVTHVTCHPGVYSISLCKNTTSFL